MENITKTQLTTTSLWTLFGHFQVSNPILPCNLNANSFSSFIVRVLTINFTEKLEGYYDISSGTYVCPEDPGRSAVISQVESNSFYEVRNCSLKTDVDNLFFSMALNC